MATILQEKKKKHKVIRQGAKKKKIKEVKYNTINSDPYNLNVNELNFIMSLDDLLVLKVINWRAYTFMCKSVRDMWEKIFTFFKLILTYPSWHYSIFISHKRKDETMKTILPESLIRQKKCDLKPFIWTFYYEWSKKITFAFCGAFPTVSFSRYYLKLIVVSPSVGLNKYLQQISSQCALWHENYS